MKWPPTKGSRYRDRYQKSYIDHSISNLTSHVTKLAVCLIATGMFLSGDASKLKQSVASVSPQKLARQINLIASNISVKVSGRDFLGSGFILQRSGQEYTVITNQHVLRAGEAPYKIETSDGKTYSAEVLSDMRAANDRYDLAILKFESKAIYPTARIGSSLYLEVGEPIFAAGFPYNESNPKPTPAVFEQPDPRKFPKLALKKGRVAIILNQALEEGYQIGYTNDVKKGMSGGPLLNSQGEVVGVNGKHAYPLWESPEVYQDGSEPCAALQELITHSSLAIPIEKTIELTPQFEFLRLPSNTKASRKSNLLYHNPQVIARMQSKAKKTKQSCQNNSEESVNSKQ